jgi:aminoglycoside phosphotransferase (APT) family kinase protein
MPVGFIDWTSYRPGDRLDDLGYMAWTWCIQAEGNVPVDAQAAHLRELRDAYGPVPPPTLIHVMIFRGVFRAVPSGGRFCVAAGARIRDLLR